MDEYLIPTQFGEAEFVEKKSRFIGPVWPVDTEEEALAKIQEMKKKHYDATHNCWAYIIRDGAVRFSDDGEPGGTAGMPMLQVLQREGLFNVVCVVTRYFGGISSGCRGTGAGLHKRRENRCGRCGQIHEAGMDGGVRAVPLSLLRAGQAGSGRLWRHSPQDGFRRGGGAGTAVPGGQVSAFLEKLTDLSASGNKWRHGDRAGIPGVPGGDYINKVE